MRKYKILILFIACTLQVVSVHAQDVIINSDNDTIYCKILEVSNENIRYQIQDVNRRVTNTLNRRYIASYQINEEKPVASTIAPEDKKTKKEPVFRFALGGGYARKIGKKIQTNDPKENQLLDDLANGFHLEGNMECYFNWQPKDAFHYGIGLHFNYISHFAAANNVNSIFGYVNRYKESQNVIYLAPAFVMRYDLQDWLFTASIGVGPVFFSVPMIGDYVQITGNSTTVGTHFSIGAEYKVSPNWGIGLKISRAGGVINSINIAGKNEYSEQPLSAQSWLVSGIVSFRTK
jgi:hypothetical protein